MVSKFLTDLPYKGTPANNDIVLIQDLDGSSTSVVSLSNLRDYIFNFQVPELSATNFTAVSANFKILDVTQYELSGYRIIGQLNIDDDGVNTYALNISSTNAIVIPVGDESQRPNPPLTGALRFSTTDNTFEGYNGVEWGALGETTERVFVDIGAGNIEAGTYVEKGTSLQDLVNSLFIKTFFPTKEEPSASSSVPTSTVEAGTIGVTITVNFNDGRILGRTTTWNPPSNVSGVWDPGDVQNESYAGAPTSYVINGTTVNTTNATAQAVFNSTQMVDGTNTFSSTVNFSQGPIPYDSKGEDYSVELPRKSAGSVGTSTSVTGARKIWYGTGLSPLTINEANIRGITDSIFTSSAGSSHSFEIEISSGDVYVVIALPTDVGTPTIVSTGGGIQTDVTGAFTTSSLTVRGANNFTGTRSNYTIYYYQPVVAFTDDTTYEVTI